VDDNSSCHEVCEPGYYLTDDVVQCLRPRLFTHTGRQVRELRVACGCVCTRASHPVSEIIQLHNPSAGNGANYIRADILWAENEMKGVDNF
jgi:hypothetical protein